MKSFDVQTTAHSQCINITDHVQKTVQDLGITDGVITVFTPHTTCAVTINENEDPHVASDLLMQRVCVRKVTGFSERPCRSAAVLLTLYIFHL